jgi:hypothetical protein
MGVTNDERHSISVCQRKHVSAVDYFDLVDHNSSSTLSGQVSPKGR